MSQSDQNLHDTRLDDVAHAVANRLARPRGFEDRQNDRREDHQLHEQQWGDIGGIAENVDGDRQAEVVRVDIARAGRAESTPVP